MNRYICIHGHFYQPPRENPWLEEIEFQDSAYPYHNWNERITAECYEPNTASRILDSKNRIIDIINNYTKISFNFGPTLLSWLEKHSPDVYQTILEADKESLKNFSGHGSAIAQVYNHLIMPLANSRDKQTQVFWGIKDFEYRFKRFPEGMWLAETAVDLETLDILAQHQIKFTILSPQQAKRVRKSGEQSWHDVLGGKIDSQIPYVCHLPSGRSIVIFFYDGPISLEIAFGDLLKNGEGFAHRLLSVFPKKFEENRLAHIASDGETYGHHHRFGNMALSYLLRYIEENQLAQFTIYGEFLEKNPPKFEVEILENSSWSCAHGVERWRSDCGCDTGRNEKWHQKWREPLRQALDGLRNELIPVFEETMKDIFKDPWAVRNHYIEVILNRSPENVQRFLNEHSLRPLNSDEKIKALKLLEIERQAMLMYTSCGWFFDDLSNIETVQIIQYAARAIQLAEELTGKNLEEKFIHYLEAAPSNLPEMGDGKKIYEQYIEPVKIDLLRVGAHYAISSLFQEYAGRCKIYVYSVDNEIFEEHHAGKQKIVIGKSLIRSDITWEEAWINFVVLHLGEQQLNAGIRPHHDQESFKRMQEEIQTAFLHHDIPEIMQLMTRHFAEPNYSLWDLFKNEQGKILNQIFESTISSIETLYRQIYAQYSPLMNIKKDMRMLLPKALAMTVEFVLNRDLINVLEEEDLDLKKLEKLVVQIDRWSFMRNKEDIILVAGQRINLLMERWAKHPEEIAVLEKIEKALRVLSTLPFKLDLWKSQNIYFLIGKKWYKNIKEKAKHSDKDAQKWIEYFDLLGEYLQMAGL